MSTKRYTSPLALERAITERAKVQAASEAEARHLDGRGARDYVSRRVNQLRRDVAFHAILARLAQRSAQGHWVVKGGVALQLRLDPSRPSRDIDVTWVGPHLDHAVALVELRAALAHARDDFFSFELDPHGAEPDETGALVQPVSALLGARRFERFTIDIAPPRDGVRSEQISEVPPPLGIEQLGRTSVQVLAVEVQVADKVCAIHEVRGTSPSSRWRDLADIAMLAEQIDGIDAGRLAEAIASEVLRRPGTLPEGLPREMRISDEQLAAWTTGWGSGGRIVPISLDDAHEIGRCFLDPVLSGQVTSGMWSAATRSWS